MLHLLHMIFLLASADKVNLTCLTCSVQCPGARVCQSHRGLPGLLRHLAQKPGFTGTKLYCLIPFWFMLGAFEYVELYIL